MPGLPGIEAKHFGEQPRCLALRDAFHVGAKANGIAALVARSEVRPMAGSHIDFEASGLPVCSRRVPGHVFPAENLPARYETIQDSGQRREGRSIDGGEIDHDRPPSMAWSAGGN
jgi:hypothetical protein